MEHYIHDDNAVDLKSFIIHTKKEEEESKNMCEMLKKREMNLIIYHTKML